MKRGRLPSSSEDSDDNGSLSTTWSQNSRSQHRRSSCSRHEDRKPSEVFRTDLITAMKLHDSYQLNPDEYYVLADPWRQEWEKGVQVPVSPGTIPQPVARVVSEEKSLMFIRPKKYIVSSGSEPPELGYVDIRTLADSVCRYDLNDMDAAWLELTNEEFKEMGMPELDEYTMERVLEEFEQRCYDNMNHAIETEEGLGIEYDEDVVCDVCQSPDGEDGNEMVFCDKCNICVHQACYGILKVPEGSWLCRTCALGVQPKCLLCPKKGGAMKPTRSGTKWVHVSCALWIPEVSIGSPEKMEPITKVSHIPSSRWALVCSLCNEKFGASIQCSVKNCRTAFHVTCAFDRGLEMKTILAENDEVKFKSYCPKHSSHRKPDESLGEGAARENGAPECPPRDPLEPFGSLEQNQEEAHRVSVRKQKLQQLEDEFYTFVNLLDVARALRLPEEVVDFLYQYWKLKRKVNFNKPLITPKKDEEDNLAKREQDVLFRRLQLFTHLRQDLERVRNLTYMVTRREKIKRSVCKVQEQIFNLYTKLLEQERVSGAPPSSSSSSLENMLLFNSPSVGPDAPKIEDLKWHSAFFRKQMGTSLVHSMKKPHKRDPLQNSAGSEGKTLLKQPDLGSRREGMVVPESFLSFEKTFAEARLISAQQKNGVVMPDHGSRRDHRFHCDLGKGDLKDRPFRQSHKPLRSTDVSQRHVDNTRAATAPGVGQSAPGTRKEMVPKCNGSLIKVNYNQTAVKVPTTPASPVKNWGGFRIPKKGERQQQGEAHEGACHQHSDYPYLGLGRVPAKERAKSKLKSDNENDGYVPDVEMSDSESEASEKKCIHASSTINRRTDIIRRSILAS
ncbi:protein Jade-1 isoform X2 [Sagmatias obliquidens]|uniref:Protein Jade-1 n=3 Tax=Delphinidae TaxID=9726 RepID=A0A2U4ARA7_TURTR|nr:protein Jade-1 isoform X2 [Tursiops truncatus]XP_019783481.1 protein Jade-1 isoform X2 [Tursiops truncatus]XP_019783482.1 protein Jade-1 isoform X2 [Tursiops truncatus]XP_019783483.1 protein Jade-1 isoform X2 [Tursiops truncatus]XP_019783484.1 protein Jade-1 isoform X2 [Tursiops truncatus]XP_019783486.1 protein Jade-1 isoform X2 [Tursiops truncatus]XP_019783487.1 protein Jade-1 isoform X2 [Tursiops truncatus]XP_026959501.1 protein Jade-1 isoform X2 [Lagenorhynchus obliquidens]XP_02695950